MRAEIDELDRQLGPDVVSNGTRVANAAQLGKTLQPCRYIDGTAEQIVALYDDIAYVNPDPEPHLLGDGSIRILLW